MANNVDPKYYSDLLDKFGIEMKGKNMLYTSHNGNMYSFISKEGEVALRLPRDEREEFLEKYDTQLVETYGTVMKEYVSVPENLYKNTDELSKWFEVSLKYVKSLKPKPTTKKK